MINFQLIIPILFLIGCSNSNDSTEAQAKYAKMSCRYGAYYTLYKLKVDGFLNKKVDSIVLDQLASECEHFIDEIENSIGVQ